MHDHEVRTLSRQRFGQFAERYVQSKTHAGHTDLDRLVAIADPQPTWRVLDVATGGGHTALRFASHVARLVAADLSPAMLQAARKHIGSAGVTNVRFAVADAGDLPFPDGSFDLVTCRIAPHHFPDIARFVHEGARVTEASAAGGWLLIQDHVLPEDATAAAYIDAFERLRDPSHNRALTERQWVRTLEGAELEVTHVEHIVKRHDLTTWTDRQDCPPDVVERLLSMLDRAPQTVRAWIEPRDLRTAGASFANRHILIAGRKRL